LDEPALARDKPLLTLFLRRFFSQFAAERGKRSEFFKFGSGGFPGH
jgi:hypothetical protein